MAESRGEASAATAAGISPPPGTTELGIDIIKVDRAQSVRGGNPATPPGDLGSILSFVDTTAAPGIYRYQIEATGEGFLEGRSGTGPLQVFAAGFHVVAPSRVIGEREVVPDAPDRLNAILRVELVARNRETRKGDARRSGDHAIRMRVGPGGGLPVIRP